MLIHNEDDIEFVTEFPCLLGHPVTGYTEFFRVQGTTMYFKVLGFTGVYRGGGGTETKQNFLFLIKIYKSEALQFIFSL